MLWLLQRLKFFFLDTDLENLALNKPAKQSSISADGNAERAVDGNYNNDYNSGLSCTHTSNDKSPWWRVDLGKKSQIYKVHFYISIQNLNFQRKD